MPFATSGPPNLTNTGEISEWLFELNHNPSRALDLWQHAFFLFCYDSKLLSQLMSPNISPDYVEIWEMSFDHACYFHLLFIYVLFLPH